jgi:hypothetical protein
VSWPIAVRCVSPSFGGTIWSLCDILLVYAQLWNSESPEDVTACAEAAVPTSPNARISEREINSQGIDMSVSGFWFTSTQDDHCARMIPDQGKLFPRKRFDFCDTDSDTRFREPQLVGYSGSRDAHLKEPMSSGGKSAEVNLTNGSCQKNPV